MAEKMTQEEVENLMSKHDKIRQVLIELGQDEFGDVIIDEICELIKIPPTTVYYED